MSGSFEGVDPPLVLPGGKSDDYPGLFTLNYAEILKSLSSHDPNQDHIGHGGAWGSDSPQNLFTPEGVNKLNGLDFI